MRKKQEAFVARRLKNNYFAKNEKQEDSPEIEEKHGTVYNYSIRNGHGLFVKSERDVQKTRFNEKENVMDAVNVQQPAAQCAAAPEKTNKGIAFAYSFGEVGSQLSWYMINTYLTIFYTDVIGLTASAVSLILLIARVWDAINDPMMGVIADKTHSRWGKFRPYLMFAPPFLAIFNVLTFTVFPVQGVTKVVVCLLCYVGAGMAYTAVCITYGSIVNLIARDSQVRMNYTSAKAMGASVIKMILSAVAMPAILYFSGSDKANATGYFWVAVVCSVVMLPCFWFCAAKCKETVRVDAPVSSGEKRSVGKTLLLLCHNKYLMMTVWAVFLGAIAVMARMSMLTYYVIYVVGSFTAIAPIFTVMTVTELIGCVCMPWGTKTFGKRNWLLLLNVLMVGGFILMFLFPTSNMTFLLIVSAIIGYGNSSANVCTGMLSDCIEYGDWKYGIREEGVTYSYMSFGVKLATAVGGSVTVLLLAASGYVPNADQTEAVKTGINAVVNLLPAICIVLSVIPLFWYKLDKKRMDVIYADLDKRKTAKAAE